MSQWITLEKAAGYIHVGRSTLYRMAQSGEVPAHKIGRSWRFSLPELDAWIRSEPGNVAPRRNGRRLDSSHSSPVRIIDLFSGAGGLTLGFTKLASRPAVTVWANGFNRYAAKTYNANFGDHSTGGSGGNGAGTNALTGSPTVETIRIMAL